MDIYITFGIGEGTTKLSAFDSALFDAGIANFNLIYLSSIIPPGSNIIERKLNWNNQHIGKKLYVVVSQTIVDEIGKTDFVGLGWINNKNSGGILAEFSSNNRIKTILHIQSTLKSMNAYRSLKGSPKLKIIKVTCRKKPACAIIAAVYRIENWTNYF